MKKGRPGFAALDVFNVEPLPVNDPLRRLPNVLLTPHLGFVTEPVLQRFANGVTECLDSPASFPASPYANLHLTKMGGPPNGDLDAAGLTHWPTTRIDAKPIISFKQG